MDILNRPVHHQEILPSGSELVRFNNFNDIFWYDDPRNNPNGIALRNGGLSPSSYYLRERFNFTPYKQDILAKAQENLEMDKDFLELIHKAKSSKGKKYTNKFGGNLIIPAYAAQSEKVFYTRKPGEKSSTLNIAIQVGCFSKDNYSDSFVKILKLVLVCQAMKINLNLDMFDSDREGIGFFNSYVIVNVLKSNEKIDFNRLLVAAHREFFNYTLFNGYAASGKPGTICTFLSPGLIIKDLSPMYDIVAGNMLSTSLANGLPEMQSKIIKIAFK